ncbi:MFS transporter [Massilia sp. CCM 9210]|uniref:MFS transporter n=1 Tax=Massilia scottii TaxID=3057166 RepID=UPI00279656F3|nr:MFS transporter [Massilia sp. CCM 9210]
MTSADSGVKSDGVAHVIPAGPGGGATLVHRNALVYTVYRMLTLAPVDRAIFVLFLIHKGFSAYQIGMLQGVFFLANIVTEVPAGLFGDAIGRKWSVLLGLLAYCLFGLGVLVSDGFLPFLGLYALLGLALALVYGSDTALLYDSLVAEQRTGDFNRIQLKANALGLISGAFAVLAGGLLQAVSWDAVYAGYVVIYALALAAWSFAIEPPLESAVTGSTRKHLTAELLTYIRQNWRAIGLPILGFIVFAACTTPFFTFSQALFSENGFSVQRITWFYCAAQLLIGLAYLVLQRSMSFLSFYPVVLLSTLVTAVMLGLMFFNVTAIDFGGFFLVMILNPIVGVVANNHFNAQLPSRVRASFLSLIGLGMSLTIAIMYFLYSYLAQYMAIYQVMASTALIAVCAFLIFMLARQVEKKGAQPC